MPRKHHIWFPGAKYHVISRGNRRSALFEDEEDRIQYFSYLKEAKEKYPFTLQAYCLMTNHTHLLIQTTDYPLYNIMHPLNLRYAKYFNRKYDYTGHVFEKRYTSELIDSIFYELQVSKYIHMNPVQANITQNAEDYPWSSYRAYAMSEKNDLVSTDAILSLFQSPERSHYAHYVKSADTPFSYAELKIIER